MFCSKSLRTNEVVEAFPVGRRLAFDVAKGRLWVVCHSCERWNLTPLEERWEAVETCEKLFGGTRLRTSSENIGLARHSEGLELVRIGKPLRPEFAAWRYGDQFGRRRNRRILLGSMAGLALTGGIAVGGALVGAGGAIGAYQIAEWWYLLSRARSGIRFRTSDGRVRALSRSQAVSHTRIRPADDKTGYRVQTVTVTWRDGNREWFEGEDARRAMDAILPVVNSMGGTSRTVREAVARIESHGDPQRFLRDTLGRSSAFEHDGVPGYIHKMPKPTRLALEMALHEEQERRALRGQLWRLERAWREAEEIAAIADKLLLPKGAAELLDERSGRGKAP